RSVRVAYEGGRGDGCGVRLREFGGRQPERVGVRRGQGGGGVGRHRVGGLLLLVAHVALELVDGGAHPLHDRRRVATRGLRVRRRRDHRVEPLRGHPYHGYYHRRRVAQRCPHDRGDAAHDGEGDRQGGARAGRVEVVQRGDGVVGDG